MRGPVFSCDGAVAGTVPESRACLAVVLGFYWDTPPSGDIKGEKRLT